MASRSLGVLTLDMILRLGGFEKGMDSAARTTERTQKRIASQMTSLSRAIKAGFAAFSISQYMQAVIRETSQAEDALAQVQARIKSTGGVAGVTTEQLRGLASEMSDVSVHGSDAILSMEALLLQFTNIRGPKVKEATHAILDLSAALGTELNSAATMVGKALQDPVRGLDGLQRAGVQFTEAEREMIKELVRSGQLIEAQDVILGKLRQSMGGAAQAAAGTLGGALKQLRNALGNLLQLDDSSKATEAVQELTRTLKDPATIAAAQTLAEAIASAFTTATKAIAGTINVSKFLYDEYQRFRGNIRSDDIVRIEEQIDRLQSKLREIDSPGFSMTEALVSDETIAKWRKDLEALVKLRDAFYAPKPTKDQPFGAGAPFDASGAGVANEEFDKAIAKLKEQIALYGKVTEVAKMRYAIETGAYGVLNAEQEKTLLGYAAQLDALNEQAEAAKAAEQAAKQLNSAFAQQVKTYEDQLNAIYEATEAEKLRTEITHGGLKGITAEQEKYLLGLAQEVDLLKLRNQIGAELDAQLKQAADEGIAAIAEIKDVWTVFMDEAARNIQDIIADQLISGFDRGAKGVLKAVGNMLVQITAQIVAADIAGKLFGDLVKGGTGTGLLSKLGNWVSGLLPSRDVGGRAMAGAAYAIGTGAQPEIFVPDVPGRFFPKGAGLGGMVVHQNFSVRSESGDRITRRTEQQVAAAAQRGLSIATRRGN